MNATKSAKQSMGATQSMDARNPSNEIERALAGWAHDLGKPLQVIWNYGRRLADLADADSQTRETALAIVALSNDALDVVDRLMDPNVAATSSEPARDLASWISEAAEVAGRLQEDREVRVLEPLPHFELDGGHRLVPVLVNLIENAMQASPPDRAVLLSSRRAGDEIVIEIRDRGVGMPERVRRRAFDAYFSTRLHPRAGVRGLGLAEARVQVEAFGGRIELESAEGRGTCASIWLPVRCTTRSRW
jgi:signal transduction histidine kinase